MKVYLDHAATTPIDPLVAEKMIEVIRNHNGNPSSIHAQGRQARALIEQSRKSIAQHIGASIGEIFFTSSATEANNTILRNAVSDLGVKRIISTPIEHPCVKNTLNDLFSKGRIHLDLLSIREDGSFDLEELRSFLDASDETCLVSCMYGNNEIGNINDVAAITKIAKEYGAFVHTDAVQILGKYPLNVTELGVDFMSGTAHKINGPKGIGLMYINGDLKIGPLQTGGSQERNMRAGTENIYGIVGFEHALNLSIENHEERKKYVSELNQYFKDQLKNIDSTICFNGTLDNQMYHICSVNFPASPKNMMMIYNLDIKGICASSGSACSSGTDIGSHVLDALHLKEDYVTIRFSFSHLNTKEEIDYTLDVIAEILEKKPVHA